MTPWLGVNYKITYSSDRTKETLYSLGINLMTGNVIDGFQESLSEIGFGCYRFRKTLITYRILSSRIRALERLDAIIENRIQQDDHTWAEEAKLRWEKDQGGIGIFL